MHIPDSFLLKTYHYSCIIQHILYSIAIFYAHFYDFDRVKRRSYTPCHDDYDNDFKLVTVSSATSTTFTYSRLIFRTALLINTPRAFFIGPALVFNKFGKVWCLVQILQEVGVFLTSFYSDYIEYDYFDELQPKLDPTYLFQEACHDYGFICYIVNQSLSLWCLSKSHRKKYSAMFIGGFAVFLYIYTTRMKVCKDYWYSLACLMEFVLLPFGLILNQFIINDMYDKCGPNVKKFRVIKFDKNNNKLE